MQVFRFASQQETEEYSTLHNLSPPYCPGLSIQNTQQSSRKSKKNERLPYIWRVISHFLF